MATNGGQIGKSEGEKKLYSYCLEVADTLGLEVDSTSWSVDIITNEHILTVVAKTGTNEVRFSQKEISDYTNGIGTGAGNDKIREALEDIVD